MTTATLIATGAWDIMLRGGNKYGRPSVTEQVVTMLAQVTAEDVGGITAAVAARVAALISDDHDEYA